MRILFLLVPILALTACDVQSQQQQAKQRFATAPILCRDGVEYIANQNLYGDSYTPHYDKDTGKPKTCSEVR